jgi:hypothetical protein
VNFDDNIDVRDIEVVVAQDVGDLLDEGPTGTEVAREQWMQMASARPPGWPGRLMSRCCRSGVLGQPRDRPIDERDGDALAFRCQSVADLVGAERTVCSGQDSFDECVSVA